MTAVSQPIQGTLFETETEVAMPVLTDYDWIVVSSSAGKDSQAMLDYVCELAEVAGVLDRVVVVHCDLGRVEWRGTREIAEAQASRYGVRFIVVWRKQGDLLEQIEQRGMFPDPKRRYCTSDQKRGPVHKLFTALAREGDLLDEIEQRGMFPDPARRYCTSHHKISPTHKLFTALVDQAHGETAITRRSKRVIKILSCMGMRAQESAARRKRPPFSLDTEASNGRRQVALWLPIHRWPVEEVWARIRGCRTADLIHYAYALGMPRVSCVFCIFAPKKALVLAGQHNPELLQQYVDVEARIGHRFRVDLSLAEVQAEARKLPPMTDVDDWTM